MSTTAPDADAETAASVVADYTGEVLADASRAAEADGYLATSHDATDGDAGRSHRRHAELSLSPEGDPLSALAMQCMMR